MKLYQHLALAVKYGDEKELERLVSLMKLPPSLYGVWVNTGHPYETGRRLALTGRYTYPSEEYPSSFWMHLYPNLISDFTSDVFFIFHDPVIMRKHWTELEKLTKKIAPNVALPLTEQLQRIIE